MRLRARIAIAAALCITMGWIGFEIVARISGHPFLGPLLGMSVAAIMLAKVGLPVDGFGGVPAWVLYIAFAAMSWMMWPLYIGFGVLMAALYVSAVVLGQRPTPPRGGRPRPAPQAPKPKSLDDVLTKLREAWERGGDEHEPA